MTLKETLAKLKSLGNEKVRAHNKKYGAGDQQFGVQLGDIRKLAKTIKTNHELAIALWETGNIDAQLLAILLMKPENLSADEMDRMVRSVTFAWVAEWLRIDFSLLVVLSALLHQMAWILWSGALGVFLFWIPSTFLIAVRARPKP